MQSRGKALAPIRRRATLDGMTRNDADEVGNNSLFPCPPRRVERAVKRAYACTGAGCEILRVRIGSD